MRSQPPRGGVSEATTATSRATLAPKGQDVEQSFEWPGVARPGGVEQAPLVTPMLMVRPKSSSMVTWRPLNSIALTVERVHPCPESSHLRRQLVLGHPLKHAGVPNVGSQRC